MCKRCKSKPINSPKKNNWTTIRLFVSEGTRGILNDDSHFAISSLSYLARKISLIVFLYNYSVCLSLDSRISDQSQFGKSHWVRHHWTHGASAPHLSHCRNVDCEKKIGSSEREIAPTCRALRVKYMMTILSYTLMDKIKNIVDLKWLEVPLKNLDGCHDF